MDIFYSSHESSDCLIYWMGSLNQFQLDRTGSDFKQKYHPKRDINWNCFIICGKMSLSLSVCLCLCLSVCLSVSFSLSLSVCVCLCLCLSLSVCLCLSLSVPFVSLSLYLFVCLSPCQSLCLSLSLRYHEHTCRSRFSGVTGDRVISKYTRAVCK